MKSEFEKVVVVIENKILNNIVCVSGEHIRKWVLALGIYTKIIPNFFLCIGYDTHTPYESVLPDFNLAIGRTN